MGKAEPTGKGKSTRGFVRSAWERARVCFSKKKKGVVRPRTTPAVVLRALQGSWPTLEKSDDESSSTTGSRNGHSSISISRESFSLHLSLLMPGRERRPTRVRAERRCVLDKAPSEDDLVDVDRLCYEHFRYEKGRKTKKMRTVSLAGAETRDVSGILFGPVDGCNDGNSSSE